MKSVKVKLGNDELVLKRSFRGLIYFEEHTGRSISDVRNTFTDKIMMLYCMIKAVNKSFDKSFDEFCDLCDDCPGIIDEHDKVMYSDIAEDAEKKSKD